MSEVDDEVCKAGLKYCKEYLGGAWMKATISDFHMEHIRGGLSNLLYLCCLSEKIELLNGEPRKVLLRLYGQIIRENPDTVLTDSVIFALLSEKQLGPKLYGVFTHGRIEEYVPSRVLTTNELHDPNISEACARIMAQFHQLQMPLVKEPRWLFDIMTRFLDEALNNVTFSDMNQDDQEKLQRVLSYGLASEVQCLRNLLNQVHSPVVFCHNDLQEGNILINASNDRLEPMVCSPPVELWAIDYEYAHYNFRGFDIGNHFCEWCYNYKISEPPYFEANLDHYPNREQQLRFIRAYLSEDKNVLSCQNGDSVSSAEIEESMLIEVNTYALASHFMWGLWGIVQSHISNIEFGYLDYALARFSAYFQQKKEVLSMIHLSNGSNGSIETVDGH